MKAAKAMSLTLSQILVLNRAVPLQWPLGPCLPLVHLKRPNVFLLSHLPRGTLCPVWKGRHRSLGLAPLPPQPVSPPRSRASLGKSTAPPVENYVPSRKRHSVAIVPSPAPPPIAPPMTRAAGSVTSSMPYSNLGLGVTVPGEQARRHSLSYARDSGMMPVSLGGAGYVSGGASVGGMHPGGEMWQYVGGAPPWT
ncbi:hypothetical protein BC829DRAFT_255250 [Chytridium lagenaria]|nr:hypothetical protein BC829DRAFT_255250 [Chytridium lagenaria]